MALFGRPTEKEQQRAERMRDWAQRQNGYAIASVVLGAISLIEFGVLLVFGIAGLATGVIALRQLVEPIAPRVEGKKLAWIGIACSVISLAMAAFLYTRQPGGMPVKQ